MCKKQTKYLLSYVYVISLERLENKTVDWLSPGRGIKGGRGGEMIEVRRKF